MDSHTLPNQRSLGQLKPLGVLNAHPHRCRMCRPPLVDPGLAWLEVVQGDCSGGDEARRGTWPLLLSDFAEVAEEVAVYLASAPDEHSPSSLGAVLTVSPCPLYSSPPHLAP